MKKNTFFFLFLFSSFLNAQDFSIRGLPYFYAADVQDYNFSGFNINAEYTLTNDKVINKLVDIGFGYAKLSQVGATSSTPEGYMLSLKVGYKFITDYNFFSSIRLRYSFVKDHLLSGLYGVGINYYWEKEYLHCLGPEIILGKRIKIFKNIFLDFGLGATYNYVIKPKDYLFIKYWPIINLELGYRFRKIES